MNDDPTVREWVDRISAEQRDRDARRLAMAEAIVEAHERTAAVTVDDWKRFAAAWIATAAQHVENEEYYRGQRDSLVTMLKRIVAFGDVRHTPEDAYRGRVEEVAKRAVAEFAVPES